jgi:hypothetical protein
MTAEGLTNLSDDELGGALATLDIAWPPTPDAHREVLRAIEHGRPPRRRVSRTTLVLIAAVTILVLAAAAAAAAKFIVDLGGIAIQSVPTVTLPASPVRPAAFGANVSQAEAEAALGSTLPVPPALGVPDRIWLERGTTSFEANERGTIVAMAWLPRADLPPIPGTPYGATLIVFRGEEVTAIKQISAPITSVGGHDAYWIDAPHELDLLVGGRVRPFRVTGTVLLWQAGGLAERLETALPQRAVLRIAFPPGA